MFAVAFDHFGGPEVLALTERPEPHAADGRLRIRVLASGVAPVDLGLRSGGTPMSKTLALPHIPGVDAAGIVDEIGAGASGAAIGDEVFGTVDIRTLGGANAEFAVLANWAVRPSAFPWEQAGAAGSSVETATRVLDLLDLRAGMTLLIDGAAGGVGSVAVQLAVARGVRVIGTASAVNHEFLASLGAEPTTYGPGLASRVGHVDRALHVSGAGSLPQLVDLTGSADTVVTIADYTAAGLGVRMSGGELAGQPSGWHGLAAAADLAAAGRFRVPVQAVFPFSRASEAHTLASSGPRQGKIALLP
ncbi:MAG: NADP-dependent oxidoreductase [Actinomycetota bacterium]